jgi:thiopurine S-methyltransferase
LRQSYADKINSLLKSQGKMIGVLFNREFQSGPPYGGTKSEYLVYFKKLFSDVTIEECYNSIDSRVGSELFIKMIK